MMGTVVFRGVPNQPESASRSASAAVCMSSATLVVPWSMCRVRSGAKVPVKACWLGPGIG
jgi:hypothetical protein